MKGNLKITHEIRDPIHTFIKLNSDERKVLDSHPFQRLRHIHQLAMTYLVYPAATHKRFEHSLGVMELAGKVFDVVTNPEVIHFKVKDLIPEINNPDKLRYWRCVLRMAALCHDLGHLPFSHAAEKELLPAGWNHEALTIEIIKKLKYIWQEMTPPLRELDIMKVAVGPSKLPKEEFSDWETILSEIITGDAFGVDRMDYLLRDAYHAGVAYGKFDHYRLIDTLRILPKEYEESEEPTLGVEEGGLHSSEALLLARYFMFSQVYYHEVRRIYDTHLKEFLIVWLEGGRFSTDFLEHQNMTDNEVLAALLKAVRDKKSPGHKLAKRIINREHFKVIYNRRQNDLEVNLEPGKAVYEALGKKFGNDQIRHDQYSQRGASLEFPVLCKDGNIFSSLFLSEVLNSIPLISIDNVYIDPIYKDEGIKWVEKNKQIILEGGDDFLE